MSVQYCLYPEQTREVARCVIIVPLKGYGMILVTGATGFIGRHLVDRLTREHRPVRVLLPLSPHRALKASWAGKVDSLPGPIQDADSLHQALTGVHTVFQLATGKSMG